MTGARPLSGLQRSVLALYRRSLRAAYAKPAEHRDAWLRFVRAEFGHHRNLSPLDFTTIEYLVRHGNKRVDTLSNPAIKRVSWQ